MSRSLVRCALHLLVALVLVSGCSDGDDDGGGSSNPTAPTTPTTPPPSGVVSVAGNWTGTSDFQQNGIRHISNLTATFRQNDRNVEGSIVFTSPTFSGWTATFTGQLSGDSPSSQFFGNVTVNGTATSGTHLHRHGGLERHDSFEHVALGSPLDEYRSHRTGEQ